MVLRLLMRLLSNNEQLISRLSESYPVRRAARLVVYLFQRGKAITEDPDIAKKFENINPDSIKSFSENLTHKLKAIKENLEKQNRK